MARVPVSAGKVPWASCLEQGLAALSTPGADEPQYLIRNGSMRVGLYAPQSHDSQEPHSQDELYIIASGHGRLVKGDDILVFRSGDVIFVEAGIVHRFEEFSDDFVTWVVFWGPAGGESVAAAHSPLSAV